MYIAPAMVVMAVMVVYPLAYGFYLSLTNMSMQNFLKFRVVGFQHYANILTDPKFYKVFWWTIEWTVINVVITMAIGIWLAILVNRKLPGKAILRVLMILPWAMPQYVAVITWKIMFHQTFGAVNQMLGAIGIAGPAWLSHPVWVKVAVIWTNIWLGFPFMMMIALGALQSIPLEMYEAADVDGATGWQKFRNITLPMIKPIMVPAGVLSLVWTFNMLNVIYLLTQGGSSEMVHILVTYVYRAAFDFYRYGYAAAFSVIIFFILMVMMGIIVRRTRATEAIY